MKDIILGCFLGFCAFTIPLIIWVFTTGGLR